MTMHLLRPLAVFLAAYSLHLGYITVFYHRALAHRAVRLHPATLRFVLATGNWVTGLDPKAWSCMHRMHHAFSDGPDDPHSPAQAGVLGVLVAQLRAYERTLYGLLGRHPDYLRHVPDLDFPVHWLNRHGLWWLPYALHTAAAVFLGYAAGWGFGLAYFAGLMSHPIEGWVINALGHAVGPRNFETPDDSRNPWLAALLIGGEGLQNNHHRFPGSARFSYRWWEPDAGFMLCRALEKAGALTIDRGRLLPRPGPPMMPTTQP
ncbi:MAG TPA: fatty acid desaturase [Vicinamibacteria bacterium]|nr:fatty acid desaturase [Vicinamibacteria bacterium]